MGRLMGIIKKTGKLKGRRVLKLCRMTLLCFIFPALLSVLYCFQEDIFQKVELYNTADSNDISDSLEVLYVSPANSASGVSVMSDIIAEFSDNIDISTVDYSTFSINPGPVTGVFTYNDHSKTVIFNPASALTENTAYTVNITTGVKNITGDSMSSDYSWSFVTGGATDPEIYVSSPLSEVFTGDTYNFGNEIVSGAKPVVFTIKNYGSGNLDITTINSDNPEFSVSIDPSPATLFPTPGPGDSTAFTIEFKPTSEGFKTAVISIANNDVDENPFFINLEGTALFVIAPEIQITRGGVILVSSVSTVNFGTQVPGHTGTIEIIMYNIGSDDLTITGYVIDGADPSVFSTDFAVPVTLTSGSTLNFHVSFSSPSKIKAKARIVFTNNDSNEDPFIIKMKGRVK